MTTINRRNLLAAAMATVVAKTTLAEKGAGRTVTDAADDDQVFELRQYTLHRGRRDTLIALFEKSFIEPQNEHGAHILGTFRDLDDPDRFVWIRGFRDMPSRQSALSAFYGGPVWRANRTAANATMLDSDNVLLLQPAAPGEGFGSGSRVASPAGLRRIIAATIYYLGGVDVLEFARFFEDTLMPELAGLGAHPLARLVSEESPNTYTQLPIREHDRAFVWFARWPSAGAEAAFASRFRGLSGWRDSAPEAVLPAFMRKPERLRLAPTARSPLR
jgi:hypothetical protein